MPILESQTLKRVFKFTHKGKEIELEDFNPAATPEDVLKFYSGQYPELTNASIEKPEFEGADMVFNITTTVGTKG
jgi:PRTRC genetic system protein C